MSGATRAEIIARAVPRLIGAGVPEPERDARRLSRWAALMDGAALSAGLNDMARPTEIARFDRAIEAREGRVPVSHIIGERAFWGRMFRVSGDVLDPRPETETLIAAALECQAPSRILDLGVGSGCILLTLLAQWPEAAGVGVDISAAALKVARQNAERHDVAGRVELRRGNWFDGLDRRFDLVVSNPPYIAQNEIAALLPEVRLHEPRKALTPGDDGLGAHRAILRGVGRVLSPGGKLFLEIGPTQSEDVSRLVMQAGFARPVPFLDMDGRIRVLGVNLGGN